MHDYIVLFNNGSVMTITAYGFEWDNTDGTVCFLDSPDSDGDYVAILKKDVLYGVGLKNGTKMEHFSDNEIAQFMLPMYDNELCRKGCEDNE